MRRIMKRSDFSHSEISILVPKLMLTRLAMIAKKNLGSPHHLNLLTIGNIFSGIQKDFSEHWINEFDVTLIECAINHPDILVKRFKLVAKYCKTEFSHIEAITQTREFNLIGDQL